MWEYKIKLIKFKTYIELTVDLNEEGNNGWEIISYEEIKPENYSASYSAKILFKRKKEIQHDN